MEYYRGYIRLCASERFINVNGIYKLEVTADHLYTQYEDLYDKNGNIVKNAFSKNYSRNETRIFEYGSYRPIQINYKFYLFDLEHGGTVNEMYWLAGLLRDSGLGEFYVEYNHFQWNDYDHVHQKPIEINDYGCTREVCMYNHLEFFELNYVEYKSTFEEFIKDKDQHIVRVAKSIYERNINFAVKYYDVPRELIETNQFDKDKAMVKKFQKSIQFNNLNSHRRHQLK